ncbi:MAG: phosphatidate cytidylyltransferase [Planctomycetota bacterium]
MSVLAQRFTFGALALGIVGGLVGLDYWLESRLGLLSLLLFLTIGGWFEYTRLAGCATRWTRTVGVGGLLASLIGFYATSVSGTLFHQVVPALVPTLFVLGLLASAPSKDKLQGLGLATLGFYYLVYPAQLCFALYSSTVNGGTCILLLLLLVKGNDIGAFLVGRKFGKTPLTQVSPNKTVEGSVGGLALGLIVAIAFATIPETPLITLTKAIALGVVVGIMGQLGDLVESYLKRVAGAKDSGNLLPAFGGILDLLDSPWFALPTFYFLLMLPF